MLKQFTHTAILFPVFFLFDMDVIIHVEKIKTNQTALSVTIVATTNRPFVVETYNWEQDGTVA